MRLTVALILAGAAALAESALVQMAFLPHPWACRPPSALWNSKSSAKVARRSEGSAVQRLACRYKMSKLLRLRERVDEALQLIPSGPTGSPLDRSHYQLPLAEAEQGIQWDELPQPLDPHYVTWRGNSMKPGVPETASIEAMKATLNPRSIRKRAQVESFHKAIKTLSPPKNSTLIDFGSGSGNLVLPLAHLFPWLQFVALDLKGAAIEVLRERAALAGLSNVRAEIGFIEDWAEPFQIALGLHVCGPATDAVIEKAVAQNAAYLVSPCCIGKHVLQPSVQHPMEKERIAQGRADDKPATRPKSRWLGSRVDSEVFSLIVTAADQSEIQPAGDDRDAIAHFRRGGLCKTTVELDRLEWTREQGYETFLIRMRGLEDYSKKDLLVGLPSPKMPSSSPSLSDLGTRWDVDVGVSSASSSSSSSSRPSVGASSHDHVGACGVFESSASGADICTVRVQHEKGTHSSRVREASTSSEVAARALSSSCLLRRGAFIESLTGGIAR